MHLCIHLKTDGATNKSANTCKEGLLHKARSDQTDTGRIACKKVFIKKNSRKDRRKPEWLEGKEDERRKAGKFSSRVMEGNKTNIKIFREWSWGRAKQDHMASVQWGKGECWDLLC